MSEELRHYGILGMKWGVRRYQASDGTLTKEGKECYNNPSDTKKSKMSLNERIKHYKLERELRTLTKDELAPARSFVRDILKEVGKASLEQLEKELKF